MKIQVACDVIKSERNGEDCLGVRLTMTGLSQEEAEEVGKALHQPVMSMIDTLHKKRGTTSEYVSIDFMDKTVGRVVKGVKQ